MVDRWARAVNGRAIAARSLFRKRLQISSAPLQSRRNSSETGSMTERGKSPPWDHNLRKPKLKLPPGACDTHFHFIGPQELYPLRPNHVFAHLDFEDDTMEDWLKLQETLGLSR